MGCFNFNGKIFEQNTAIVGPDNRGIRYGDGLFETMKFKDNIICFEKGHFERLWKGMQILQMDIPKHFTAELVSQQIHGLIQKNKFNTSVRVRLQVFRGDGGLYDFKNNLNYVIQVWPLQKDINSWNENGLVMGIYRESRKICDAISNLKHSNYLPYVLAALAVKKQKWNDAILLNEKFRICETTIANIFIIKNNIIKTPSLQEGCIEGVMRSYVLKQLIKKGWEINEGEISEKELKSADEVFISNSIYNIRWVKQIDEIQYRNDIFKQIYTQLF